MINHPLVKYAKRYPAPTTTPIPDSCRYEMNSGYWVMQGNDLPMMTSDSANMPATKKADRETGEDMKGE
mgnify:CR=1 FL=1